VANRIPQDQAALSDADNPAFADAGTTEPAEALLSVVLATNRIISAEALRAAPALRLTPPQFRILHYLLTAPGASLSDVAAHLGVRLPTASVMLVKLGEEGYVHRARDPASRRRMRLVLTEKGRASLLRVRDILFRRLTEARATLTHAERDAVDAAMPALRRLLDQA